MKAIARLLGLTCVSSVLLTTLVFSQPCFFNVANLPAEESWNKFVVIQLGNASTAVHARHAGQIGYNSTSRRLGYVPEYRNNPDFIGLKFLLIDPQYYRTPVLTSHSRNIDTRPTSRLSSTQAYSQSYMDFYNQNVVLKSIGPLSNNLSTGWWTSDGAGFGVRWDFQQQTVIDMIFEAKIDVYISFEEASLPFTFSVYMHDITRLDCGFRHWNSSSNQREYYKRHGWYYPANLIMNI